MMENGEVLQFKFLREDKLQNFKIFIYFLFCSAFSAEYFLLPGVGGEGGPELRLARGGEMHTEECRQA